MLFQKNIVKKYLAMLPTEQAEAAWRQYKGYFLDEVLTVDTETTINREGYESE